MSEMSGNDEIKKLVDDIVEKQKNKDTQGIVFLKSGIDLFIPSYFENIRYIWLMYKKAIAEKNNQELKELLEKYTVGGVVSPDGIIHIDIEQITGSVKVNENDLSSFEED